jgi:hypothetical protein
MLPKLFELTRDLEKQLFLEKYVNLYLKEEVWAEKYVCDLAAFLHFKASFRAYCFVDSRHL